MIECGPAVTNPSRLSLSLWYHSYYMYWDYILFVTLPFKMSQMDTTTKPLSHCGLFSKEASIFKIWGFQQNHTAQSFLHQKLYSLCTI